MVYLCINKMKQYKKLTVMNTKLALFHANIGQITIFIDAKECLLFPLETTKNFWFEDEFGVRYSFFEAMSKFWN